MVRHRRARPVVLIALVAWVVLLAAAQAVLTFPDYIAINDGEEARLHWGIPLKLHVRADRSGVLRINGSLLQKGWSVVSASSMAIEPLAVGEFALETRLLGVVPFRRVTVDVLPPIQVVPGGHSIGVLLKEDGVAVVGHAPVVDDRGRTHHPALDAGLMVNDLIMSINGQEVTSVQQVSQLVDRQGRQGGPVVLAVRRGDQVERIEINPVYNPDQRRWLMGVWIRDSAAGVGTLTFYHPGSGVYGALGHLITGPDSRRPVDVDQGQIVEASVLSIEKGQEGRPGEKVGRFSGPSLGTVLRNTEYGIFGRLTRSLPPAPGPDTVKVALASQVETGPAEIITVIEGEKMQRFSVEIERIISRRPGGKNMVLRITDPRLLAATGGIVQGMSGSPILQNGRLAGAVTHVFVNDPTRGYGVLAHWMVVHSGLLEQLGAQVSEAA